MIQFIKRYGCLYSVLCLFTLNCVQSLPALPNYDIWGDSNGGSNNVTNMIHSGRDPKGTISICKYLVFQ